VFLIYKHDETNDRVYVNVSDVSYEYYYTNDTPHPFLHRDKVSLARGPKIKELVMDRYKALKKINKGKVKYNVDFNVLDYVLYVAKSQNDNLGSYNVCSFDIEVHGEVLYEPKNPKGEISLVSMFFENQQTFIQLINTNVMKHVDEKTILQQLHEHIGNENLLQDVKEIKFVYVDNEQELLYTFAELIKQNHVDVLNAWNIYYDINYIYNRTLYLGLDISIFSPIGKPMHPSSKLGYALIPGIIVMDSMDLYKTYRYPPLTHYTLDHVAKVELNVGKVDYEGTFYEFAMNDPNRFIAYSMIDTILLHNINKRQGHIDLHLMVKDVAWCSFVNCMSTIAQIEGLLYQFATKKGLVIRQRPYGVTKDHPFKGAFVREPRKGYIPWVVDIDASSMYPSIIMTLNISPETFIGYIENVTFEFMEKMLLTNEVDDVTITINTTPSLNYFGVSQKQTMTVKELKQFIKQYDLIIAYNGTIFLKNVKGIVAEIEETLVKLRKQYKDKAKQALRQGNIPEFIRYDTMQKALKVLANAVYGATGNQGYRFFDVRISTAITLTGQIENKIVSGILDAVITDFFEGKIDDIANADYSKYMVPSIFRRAEGQQYYVFYSDTDSSFIDIFDLLALEVKYLLDNPDILEEERKKLKQAS